MLFMDWRREKKMAPVIFVMWFDQAVGTLEHRKYSQDF